MKKYCVLVPVSSPSASVGSRYTHEMEALGELDVSFEECLNSEEEFAAAAGRAHAVYVRGITLTARMIEHLDQCRVIVLGSVGVEYIDMEAATAKGIPVVNCPDTFTEEVADHTMMLLLAVHRRALEQDQLVRSGRWEEGRKRLLRVPRLRGLTLGLVGFGRVARAVAGRANAFGLRVIAYDPYVDEQIFAREQVQSVFLSELLPIADFISLHLPETIATRELLSEVEFSQMKPGAIFVNTGRASTINESSLISALTHGRLAGAGLDVFSKEPIESTSPLLSMPNVILSPHTASASSRFDPARKRRIGHELALILSGRWPMSCVNPVVLRNGDLRPWRVNSTI